MSTDAEDGCVRATDSAAVILAKIDAYLKVAPGILFPRVAEKARQYEVQKLTRNDRDMAAVLFGINLHIGEMQAELLMPEALIGKDKRRRELRNKINATLIARPHSTIKNPYNCTFFDLPRMRNEVIDAETFTRLVQDLPEYQALLQANERVEQLIVACEEVAARRCAYRCGTFAPLIKCDACEQFYCGSSCLHAHESLNRCKPPQAAS